MRSILSPVIAVCVVCAPAAAVTPNAAAAPQAAADDGDDHGHAEDGSGRHAGHFHDWTAADHNHDYGGLAELRTPEPGSASGRSLGRPLMLVDAAALRALERPPRSHATP